MPKTQKANALLIVLLLISVLSTLSLSLAKLLTIDTQTLSHFINNGQVQLLAEGQTELGLYKIKANPEGTFDTQTQEQELESHEIINKTNHFPYLENIESTDTIDKFYPLKPNQSLTFKLEDDIDNFLVEYFIPAPINKQQEDILSWKLFGETANGELETLTEYFPVTHHNSGGSMTPSDRPLNENTPAKFGTRPGPSGFNCGTLFKTDSLEEPQRCGTLISNFMNDHNEIYLSLINGVNPTTLTEKASILYFRLCQGQNCDQQLSNNKNIIPQMALINAKASNASGFEKEIQTFINPKSLTPVLDYSIYDTSQ